MNEQDFFEFLKKQFQSTMNINKIFKLITESVPDADMNLCCINNTIQSLADIEKEGYEAYTKNSQYYLPNKLYKYFPNKWITEQGFKKPRNYSLEALKNNTVYLQSPEEFDDTYDSNIHIKYKEYEKIRLHIYCQRCGFKISDNETLEEMYYKLSEAFQRAWEASSNDLTSIFMEIPKSEFEKVSNLLFANYVEFERNRILEWNSIADISLQEEFKWEYCIRYAIHKEYDDYVKYLRNALRISCFTTSPHKQLMWAGHYADFHRGFCVEYKVDRNNAEYENIFKNIFPVIYCKSRPDMTERILNFKDDIYNEEKLWNIYFHGVLRKSIDWIYQNEWRFLQPKDNDPTKYNYKFYPISKVYLGCRMDNRDRKDIIKICDDNKIPYIFVRRAANTFEIEDCDKQCETCSHYLQR